MTPTKYQKYVFGLKSGHLKIGANGAGAYTIPRSVPKGLSITRVRLPSKPAYEPSNGPKLPVCTVCALVL